jgi:cobaltochelatase CobS
MKMHVRQPGRAAANRSTPSRGEGVEGCLVSDLSQIRPTETVSVREVFGIDSDLRVPAFAERDDHVPEIDAAYRFNPDVTLAILAGFSRNRRVMVQGLHGTGKSTHIEQVAARLNWPCVRVNLDGHISRLDLVGKDAIVLREGLQVTEFQEGIVPWALQRPVALLFDEYDAGRPDVMFVIQRILERDGKFTLLDQNRVIQPHPASACSPPPTPWAWAT